MRYIIFLLLSFNLYAGRNVDETPAELMYKYEGLNSQKAGITVFDPSNLFQMVKDMLEQKLQSEILDDQLIDLIKQTDIQESIFGDGKGQIGDWHKNLAKLYSVANLLANRNEVLYDFYGYSPTSLIPKLDLRNNYINNVQALLETEYFVDYDRIFRNLKLYIPEASTLYEGRINNSYMTLMRSMQAMEHVTTQEQNSQKRMDYMSDLDNTLVSLGDQSEGASLHLIAAQLQLLLRQNESIIRQNNLDHWSSREEVLTNEESHLRYYDNLYKQIQESRSVVISDFGSSSIF